MSHVITSGNSAAWPTWLAAMTPAAGPDSIDSTGIDSTRSAGSVPPLDVMMESGAECRPMSGGRNSPKYLRMRGAT